MPTIPSESHPVAVILYCGICGIHEVGKPVELKNLHDALLDHLKRHHKNREAAERNLHGRLVNVERLNDEINIKMSYSDSETKDIIAELEGFTNK